jgi:hypothetical protein
MIASFGGPLDEEHSQELVPHNRDEQLAGVEEVLSMYRSDAFVLEEYNHLREASLIHEICSDVRNALADFIAFVDEDEAVRLTKRTRASLRQKFTLWEQQGHAWMEESMGYHYRAIVLGLILAPPAEKKAGSADQA